MKYKLIIPATILGGLAIFFSFRLLDGNKSKAQNQNEVILSTVMNIIQEGHYSPKDLNDSFSAHVFKKTIENLDFEKKFFLAEDIQRLEAYKYKIDDEIKNNDLGFFNELNTLFNTRIKDSKKYVDEILKTPIDLNSKDSLQLDPEKLAYEATTDALRDRWRKQLTYRTLIKYEELLKDQTQKLKDSANYKAKSLKELEEAARNSTIKVQNRYFARLQKLTDNDRFSVFMNSITETEDPHTTFLQPTDRKRFEEMMSGTFIGIGATLQQQDDGRVKVTSIVTGSPSWKQGRLKQDDLIEKVAQGDELPMDVDGFDLEDVVKMIRGPKNSIVNLSVKHADGTKEVIAIKRGKVELDYVFAKSAIIDDNGSKIGYINLPEFYANFNDVSSRRSSTDVEEEVKKLMAANVDGIMIDLRNNGGGSLSDVVDMVGLFVGSGPVVQVAGAGGRSMVLRSRRPEPLYTGPLAVMINGGSASASEIMAAALQDYKRAVVIGTRSFGKGTVQKIVPLDQFVSSADREMILSNLKNNNDKPSDFDGIGSIKITIQKFYRIDGGSTQLRGVIPDISLPDAYELLDASGERKDPNALPWDKIPSSSYSTIYAKSGFEMLRSISETRVSNNPNFNMVKETAQRLKDQKDNSMMALSEAAYKLKTAETEKLSKRLEALDSVNTGLNIALLKVDLPRLMVDEASKETNNKQLKAWAKDPYIFETANILNDWISGKAKFAAK